MSSIAHDYLNHTVTTLQKLQEQAQTIEKVSQLFFETINNDGLVHIYGSGHSRMGAEEFYPRHGSYPGYHPIVENSTTNYHQVVGANGLSQSMFIENVEGLAWHIMRNFEFKKQDCFLLFSTSGAGSVVIEMAMLAKEQGLPVVVITGVENSNKAVSKHSSGKKLMDVADIVIDNLVPLGDASMWIEGCEYPIGPMSTITNSTIVNMIKVRVAELLTQAGNPPVAITSSHVVGPEKSKESFDKAYAEYARLMKR